MPIDHTAFLTSDIASTEAGRGTVPEMGDEATLRLLRACVEAMGLLQTKVEGFDGLVAAAQAETGRDAANLRVEFAGMLGTQSRDGARLTDVEAQLGRLQASHQDFGKRLADDIAGARAEAAHWRMRVETDAMAFDQLSTRMEALEQVFRAKLQAAEQGLQERDGKLAERAEENKQLKSETRIVEVASDRLRQQLTVLEGTIAEQRARIGCLQSKLATATYAKRMESLAREMDGSDASVGHDIMDLSPMSLPLGRTSAA